MHKKGKCDAFLSAGNTGALLAASTFLLGKLEGVSRPTIAAIYPTIKGPRLVMDAGANLEVRPSMFVEFAKMGRVFASEIMDVEDPQIGLLNVGEEEEKGTENLKNAYDELQSLPNFIGNVEGGDIFSGKADVFLCDGLIGNIVLKFGESIPEALELFVKKGIRDLGLGAKEAKLVSKVLKTSLAEFDPDKVGGVPFLGVDGLTMVGHGSSSPLAIKNMILSAAKCVDHNINEKIVASLK
jgi:glycerol-3-phosphate acyltransferase PlsX